jgi:hypothetical protein
MSIRFSEASPDCIRRFYEFIRRATTFDAPPLNPCREVSAPGQLHGDGASTS